jgi:hypothetical protein
VCVEPNTCARANAPLWQLSCGKITAQSRHAQAAARPQSWPSAARAARGPRGARVSEQGPAYVNAAGYRLFEQVASKSGAQYPKTGLSAPQQAGACRRMPAGVRRWRRTHPAGQCKRPKGVLAALAVLQSRKLEKVSRVADLGVREHQPPPTATAQRSRPRRAKGGACVRGRGRGARHSSRTNPRRGLHGRRRGALPLNPRHKTQCGPGAWSPPGPSPGMPLRRLSNFRHPLVSQGQNAAAARARPAPFKAAFSSVFRHSPQTCGCPPPRLGAAPRLRAAWRLQEKGGPGAAAHAPKPAPRCG